MSTAQQIIDNAIGRSTKNTSRIADVPNELMRILGTVLDTWVTHAAVTAPTSAFEETITLQRDMVPDPPGPDIPIQRWTIPVSMLAVTFIADPATPSVPIAVIPREDQTLWRGLPALVKAGQSLIPSATHGETMDEMEDLLVTGSVLLPSPDALEDELDARWPERFDPLLEIGLARYMATKDGRDEEMQGLAAEEAQFAALYDSWLGVKLSNITSREAPVSKVATARQRPARERHD